MLGLGLPGTCFSGWGVEPGLAFFLLPGSALKHPSILGTLRLSLWHKGCTKYTASHPEAWPASSYLLPRMRDGQGLLLGLYLSAKERFLMRPGACSCLPDREDTGFLPESFTFFLLFPLLVGSGWAFTQISCLKSCFYFSFCRVFSPGRQKARDVDVTVMEHMACVMVAVGLLREHTHLLVKLVMAEDRNRVRAQGISQTMDSRFQEAPGKVNI